MAEDRVRRLALEVLSALSHAHGRGIVHRDVKPANIFFDAHDRAKVGDFGVAHLLDLGQTQTGALIGTLAYMAPEQVTGAPLTATADLYALGVTLFQALTGRLPFLGPDFVAQHLGEIPPAPSAVAPLAAAWDDVIGKLLAKDPAARYASADETAEAVAAVRAQGRAVLVLPRAGAPEPAPAPTPIPDAAPRYRGETPLGETAISTLARAVDGTLGRTVVVERFRELDEATERRLLGLAAGTSPFLQRVLSFDRAERVAIYEAPVGRPLAGRVHPGPRRLASELLRALLPVHAVGAAHGAVVPERILLDEETGAVTLLCAGLGPAPPGATPAEDVRAAAALAGLEPAADAASMLAALS